MLNKPFRPLLAAKIEDGRPEDIQFPVLASPKLDGIRVICHHEMGPITRSAKPVQNKYIRQCLNHPLLKRLDGEVIVGGVTDTNVFNTTQSAVMSFEGEPSFTYYAFDHYGELSLNCPFSIRMHDVIDSIHRFQSALDLANTTLPGVNVVALEQVTITSWKELEVYEQEQLELGFEGVMFRKPGGKYKLNRSTFKEQILVKMKRFVDAEAKIIGWEPLYRNENEAFQDERGYQKRSSHQAGKIADYTRVGKFILEGINGQFKGTVFKCGSGLTDSQRLEYAAKLNSDELGVRNEVLWQIVTYKYQPYGSIDAPRAPIFKGMRYDL